MRAELLGVALVLTAASARAEPDEVRVQGTQAGGFVSRASVDDAPRVITDAASLVEPLPGVHVRRLGADDSFATLSIRGSSSSQVAVFLAGVPLSGGADPTLDLATLPLWPGARATVHRSFAPAALGRGSLGGTLVIDPPAARARERTEVWAAAGAFGSRRLRVGDIRTVGDVSIATGVSASRSEDDFSYLDRLASSEGHDVFTTRRNASHAAAAGLVSVGIPIRLGHDRGALTMTTLAQTRRQELPGSATAPTVGQRLASSRLVEAIELTLPAGRGAFGVRAWGRREGLALRDDPVAARHDGLASSTDDAILAAGGSAGWRGAPIDDTTIDLRLDGSGERFAPGTWALATPPPGARRTNAGLALDTTARLRSLTLSMSGRADAWVDTSDERGARDETELRPTGNVGVELPLGPVVAASHAGFVSRPPSFVERYGNRGAFLGTPGLRPESAFTTDAGAKLARRLGSLRLEVEVAGFASWADDLITFVYVGFANRAKATNIGSARLLGLESSLRAAAFGFDARISYTGLATVNGSECLYPAGICERPSLPGRPAHDLVVDLAWERGPVRLRYGIDVVSGIRAGVRDAIEVPARMLHGAGVRLAVPGAPGLAMTLDVRNLFDLRAVDYAGITGPVRAPIGDQLDYPLPGRRILLSAQWVR